jgi:uncharacterized UPF0160 family protein
MFNITPKLKLVTHNGAFHADDIFSTAVLFLVLEKSGKKFQVFRTRDEEIINKGDYVYDIGGVYDPEKNKFDHHQKGGAGKRENGIEYASIGLVWKKFGIELCGDQKIVDWLDKKIIAPIDANDNGIEIVENKSDVSPYLIQHVFGSMRPTWKEDSINEDDVFLKCVDMAKVILTREIIQAKDAIEAECELLKIYNETEDKRIIVLDKENYPFDYFFSRFPEPVFVVCKRKINDTWGAKAVRADLQTFKNRKEFPEAWAGLRDADLQKVSGVSDAVFCHRALFLAVAGSKEGAIKLAQIALES